MAFPIYSFCAHLSNSSIKAIKKAGGLVIAREPHGTEFNSMPANAIATGMVDFVLKPAAMPAAIEDYAKRDIDLLASGIHDEQQRCPGQWPGWLGFCA